MPIVFDCLIKPKLSCFKAVDTTRCHNGVRQTIPRLGNSIREEIFTKILIDAARYVSDERLHHAEVRGPSHLSRERNLLLLPMYDRDV